MRLGSILDGLKRRPPLSHPVKFRVVGENDKGQPTASEPVDALLVLVPDDEVQALLVEAEAALVARFPKTTPPDRVRVLEERHHFLARALRDHSDSATAFGSADEMRACIIADVADDLMATYRAFVAREFPPQPTPEQIDALAKEAAGK